MQAADWNEALSAFLPAQRNLRKLGTGTLRRSTKLALACTCKFAPDGKHFAVLGTSASNGIGAGSASLKVFTGAKSPPIASVPLLSIVGGVGQLAWSQDGRHVTALAWAFGGQIDVTVLRVATHVSLHSE